MSGTTGSPSSYDGNHVVIHKIAPNENLSVISSHYKLPHWHCIWLYNTRVRKIYMGNNPHVIKTGETLFIPRRPAGYDNLIKKFQQLKREMQLAGDIQRYSLESDENLYKADAVMFDFAADVATTLATFGLKAAAAAKSAKVAQSTAGRGRVAAQYLADNRAKDLSKWTRDTFKSKATGWLAGWMDNKHKDLTGKSTTVGATTHKTLGSLKKGAAAVAGFSMIGGKALLDVADVALDYLSPTKLANAYLLVTTGETVEDTFKNQQQQIRATVAQANRNMDMKIKQYLSEKSIVHPPGGGRI